MMRVGTDYNSYHARAAIWWPLFDEGRIDGGDARRSGGRRPDGVAGCLCPQAGAATRQRSVLRSSSIGLQDPNAETR